MSIVLTGGAGFIGRNIMEALNERGVEDIIIVDNIGQSEKWKNIVNFRYREYINKSEFLQQLDRFDISMIIHMGACSATTETDFDYLYKNNVEFSKTLYRECSSRNIGFVYASTAATYGADTQFNDEDDILKLKPLNRYGYSKLLFDLWVAEQTEQPLFTAGLKFFNVFGFGEHHKGTMASVAYHAFNQITETGRLKLFKSAKPEYQDGGQLRDFVYVKDVCDVVMWFMDNKQSGLFNVGSGVAHSFKELGEAVFKAMNKEINIEYIEMPVELRDKYQYFTCAKLEKLRSAGCDIKFGKLEESVMDYINKLSESQS